MYRGLLFLPLLVAISWAQNVDPFNYTDGGIALEGYRALPAALSNGPVPAVVILPYVHVHTLCDAPPLRIAFPSSCSYRTFLCVCSDANGVNDYEQLRAVMIAEEFGWVGFAADIYGRDLHNVTDPTQRSELLDLYRSNATLYTDRIQAAIDAVAGFDEVDAENIAIIGYCFGGTGVLTYALSGLSSVKSVVSFHGGLMTIPPAGPSIVPSVLVLSGGEDDMSTEIVDLEDKLNLANATWEITRYSGIQHGFTVFGSDGYNEWADKRSWESMGIFLNNTIGQVPFSSNQPDAATVEDVPYTDVDGTQLQGYLAMPGSGWKPPYTTVVILP
jgi:dienelactone hydrolase